MKEKNSLNKRYLLKVHTGAARSFSNSWLIGTTKMDDGKNYSWMISLTLT